jgi:hypothetical protein
MYRSRKNGPVTEEKSIHNDKMLELRILRAEERRKAMVISKALKKEQLAAVAAAGYGHRIVRRGVRVSSDEPNTYPPTTEETRCTECFESKPPTEYHLHNTKRDGIRSVCKECMSNACYPRTEKDTMCLRCKVILVSTEFNDNKRRPSGINATCKKCSDTPRSIVPSMCKKCNKLLCASEYYSDTKSKNGLKSSCKACVRLLKK